MMDPFLLKFPIFDCQLSIFSTVGESRFEIGNRTLAIDNN